MGCEHSFMLTCLYLPLHDLKGMNLCLQHSQEVWREDACVVAAGSTQLGFKVFQVDWVWWWISYQKCGVSHCSGCNWSESKYSTFCFIFHFKIFITSVLRGFYMSFFLIWGSWMWYFFYIPQLVDLKVHNLCIHIFSLNDDSPSTLALEEEEELSAANHWLLPAGDYPWHVPSIFLGFILSCVYAEHNIPLHAYVLSGKQS